MRKRFDPQERSVTELVNYDRAFIVLHGRGGEDGQIQGALEWLNVPYTGTGVQGSAIGMDKVKTKQVWQGSELPTAPYRIVTKDSDATDIVGNAFRLAIRLSSRYMKVPVSA